MSINIMDLSIIKPVIFSWKKVSVSIEKNVRITSIKSGAPNENIVKNHLNIALLNVF